MKAGHALANLLDACRVLEAIGARPFLVDGTLLGCIREKAFIAYDRDVDLGLFAEDAGKGIPATMKKSGFEIRKELGSPERGRQWSFRKRDLKVDIFVYYLKDGMRYHAAWVKRRIPIRYDYPVFGLVKREFYRYLFRVPENPEAFLTRKYGDWRTKVKDWDWAWGPKNAQPWIE